MQFHGSKLLFPVIWSFIAGFPTYHRSAVHVMIVGQPMWWFLPLPNHATRFAASPEPHPPSCIHLSAYGTQARGQWALLACALPIVPHAVLYGSLLYTSGPLPARLLLSFGRSALQNMIALWIQMAMDRSARSLFLRLRLPAPETASTRLDVPSGAAAAAHTPYAPAASCERPVSTELLWSGSNDSSSGGSSISLRAFAQGEPGRTGGHASVPPDADSLTADMSWEVNVVEGYEQDSGACVRLPMPLWRRLLVAAGVMFADVAQECRCALTDGALGMAHSKALCCLCSGLRVSIMEWLALDV
jgi:hypothetical protein